MPPNIQALKLFHDQDQLYVAIFAEPTESSDGWLRNFPWHEVFVHPPDSLASDELIPLEHIRYTFTFQPDFVAEWFTVPPEAAASFSAPSGSAAPASQPTAKSPKPLNLGQYCIKIAKKTGLTPEEVRKCCEPLLEGIANQIRSGTPFQSWILTGTPVEEPSIPAAEGQPAKPSTKFMRMEVSKAYGKRRKAK